MKKILFVFADNPVEFNTSNWRMIIPATALKEAGVAETQLMYIGMFQNFAGGEAAEKCEWADIIIVERNFFSETLPAVAYWIARGKKVVANFDDAYNYITPDNQSYPFWGEGKATMMSDGQKFDIKVDPPPLFQFKKGLALCGAALLPSRKLMLDWSNVCNTYYLANYMNTKKYKRKEIKKKEKLIIGWGGSLSHFKSFKDNSVIPAIYRIIEEYPDTRVMICGDKKVFDLFELTNKNKMWQNFVPFDYWSEVVRKMDVGLAPLSGEYDKRRSWIKPMEYMITGIPWVASDNGAYDEIRQYGKLVDNTEDAWYNAIKETIVNYYELDTTPAYEFAMSQDATLNANEILRVIETAVEESY